MTSPRLLSAAAAIVLFVGALTAAATYAHHVEARSVHAVAPQMFAQKSVGAALQRAAFRQADLLPMYGSSDLNIPNPYHASALFRDYPTGFTVFPIGNPGSTSLIWLQALAAIGPDLRGKKVALSVSARPFMNETVDRDAYAANFSHLHASELAFSTNLSFAVKQDAARRMLQYPVPLASDRLLRFALAQLADGSLGSRVLYYASWPLGKLHNLILGLQDDWETLIFLRAQLGLGAVRRRSAEPHWLELGQQAERESQRKADSNPFGFDNAFWASHAPEISMQRAIYASQGVERSLERSAEWVDLDLLLRALRDLGAEPLILSIPMNGAYYDHLGVPLSARRVYYDRLRELATTHQVLAIDFADHDTDKYFTVDPSPHLSGKGWVHYDHALDAFFRDRQRDNL